MGFIASSIASWSVKAYLSVEVLTIGKPEELSALAKEVKAAHKKWEGSKMDKDLKQSYFSKLVRSSKRKHRKARNDKLLQDQRKNHKELHKNF